MGYLAIAIVVLCSIVGAACYIYGFEYKESKTRELLEIERNYYNQSIEFMDETYKKEIDRLNKRQSSYIDEIRMADDEKLKNILEEIADVTGITVVELPSFGTLYLKEAGEEIDTTDDVEEDV